MWSGSLHSKKHCCQVGPDDLLKWGEGCLPDGGGAWNSGIGEYDITLGELLSRSGKRAPDRFDTRPISLNGQQPHSPTAASTAFWFLPLIPTSPPSARQRR